MPFVDLLNQPSTPSIVCSIVLALSVTYYIIMGWLGGNHGFNPKGKHVFITGGSEGLGLNLAIELAKQGANICIVARRVPVLEKAVQKIKEAAVSSNQKIEYVSSDLSSNSGCQAAVQQAKEKIGSTPDYAFMCAGGSTPKLFLDHKPEDFEWFMKLNYLSAAWTARELAQCMKEEHDQERTASAGIGGQNGDKRKLVFISSTLGFVSFAGYSSYSPTKYALRGLADTLRNELLAYNIDTHIYYAGNLDTAGFAEENKTKPEVTKKIEGVNSPLPPAVAAQSLIAGIKRGQFAITSDFLTNVIRCGSMGISPGNYPIIDLLLTLIAAIAMPIFRMMGDHDARTMLSAPKKQKNIANQTLESTPPIKTKFCGDSFAKDCM